MLGPAIVARAMGVSAITTLIGNRLYPKAVPEEVDPVYPLAAYVVEDQDREGTYGGGCQLVSAKVTIAFMARSPAVAAQVRSAFLDAFEDQSGTWGDTVVQGAFFEDENELADRDPTTGELSQYFGSELQFLVWYEN